MILVQRFLNTKCNRRDFRNFNFDFRISQRAFIQQETTFKTLEIENLQEQVNKMKNDLKTAVSFFYWSHIANTFAESNIKTIERVKGMQDYKITKRLGSTIIHDPKEVIYNFSSYVLSEMEKALLCKELNFAIPPKKLKFENYFLPFEICSDMFVIIQIKLVMMIVC